MNLRLTEKPSFSCLSQEEKDHFLNYMGFYGRFLYDFYGKELSFVGFNTWIADLNILSMFEKDSAIYSAWNSFDNEPSLISSFIDFPGKEEYHRYLERVSQFDGAMIKAHCWNKTKQLNNILSYHLTDIKTQEERDGIVFNLSNFYNFDVSDLKVCESFYNNNVEMKLTNEVNLDTVCEREIFLNVVGTEVQCLKCMCSFCEDEFDDSVNCGDVRWSEICRVAKDMILEYGRTTYYIEETNCPLCISNLDQEVKDLDEYENSQITEILTKIEVDDFIKSLPDKNTLVIKKLGKIEIPFF